ncbi:MAG: L-ribulose-5-phosphate 4-epimerase [Anaerolineaceae bacterium]|jgi:L-ribulose-5-phosphate 4-epimerase
MLLPELRKRVWRLHLELPKNNLVAWTGGNISARDPQTGYMVIKPSGILYEALSPANMVILDLQGNLVEGDYKPSSDSYSHLYIYRNRADVNGVVHTHSRYATAFAAVGKPIPVYLTAHADEFGQAIPCAGFALIGNEDIGRVVCESIGACSAVLLKNHGVFTIGKSVEEAVKAAVMVEDVAATVWLALQLGAPDEIAQKDVERLHFRYKNIYGQK